MPLLTGASALALSATVLLVVLLSAAPAPAASASVTWMLTWRVAEAAVGSSEVLTKVTLRSAAWYCATLAVPLSVSTPATSFQLPLMPLFAAKSSASPSL